MRGIAYSGMEDWTRRMGMSGCDGSREIKLGMWQKQRKNRGVVLAGAPLAAGFRPPGFAWGTRVGRRSGDTAP